MCVSSFAISAGELTDVLFTKDETISPADQIAFAKGVINELLKSDLAAGWAEQWAPLRIRVRTNPSHCLLLYTDLKYFCQFLQQFLAACDRLSNLPSTTEELESFDPLRRLKWDAATAHPWFPQVPTPA
jgi:hypothetical protein